MVPIHALKATKTDMVMVDGLKSKCLKGNAADVEYETVVVSFVSFISPLAIAIGHPLTNLVLGQTVNSFDFILPFNFFSPNHTECNGQSIESDKSLRASSLE